jgi:hypothetical protein
MKFSIRLKGATESDADICRRNGWTVGTQLAGDEGYGVTVIQLTAIGESSIMAKIIPHKGIPEQYPHEGAWTLSCRDWKKVEAEAGA